MDINNLKNQIWSFAAFIALMICPHLEGQSPIIEVEDRLFLEFRTSYYYPVSQDFRKIFSSRVDYQLLGTYVIFPRCPNWLNGLALWCAVDYYSDEARLHSPHFKTTIRMVPATIGLRYYFPCNWADLPINFYTSAGFKYYFMHVHNHTGDETKTIKRKSLGAVIEGGFIVNAYSNIILDCFASYSFKRFGAHSTSNRAVKTTSFDVSGFNVGGGIGYYF